ncbi:hypothetical protein C2845_PM11G09320 [Panicum miliaceum]|uniref:Uncharacterized protein n=1 Tax=Panicum miliaceum TaxID=4540 RepID=A0A3L6RWU3_PANMI|nr:hypothetical protein C2845_PM11G09320 [Panicum miliaceum]
MRVRSPPAVPPPPSIVAVTQYVGSSLARPRSRSRSISMTTLQCSQWWLDGHLLLVEVVDEVGGFAVDVALADPPAAVVLVAGAHLAHVPGPAVPVAHVVVVPPRLAQEAEDRTEERLASHAGRGELASRPRFFSLLPLF